MIKNNKKFYLEYDDFIKYQKFNDGGFLQYTLGLQSCKTNGDVVELLKEVFEHGRRTGLYELGKAIVRVKK